VKRGNNAGNLEVEGERDLKLLGGFAVEKLHCLRSVIGSFAGLMKVLIS
jgi:hypothetical protein